MKPEETNPALDFFITTMPGTRPAHYYLGYYDGSVYLDFNNVAEGHILLKRISFDGYGCCHLSDKAVPVDHADSQDFKAMLRSGILDQPRLRTIVKKTIWDNRALIWNDALAEYDLL